MKNVFSILYIVFSLLFLIYLSLPEPKFPTALWDFMPSDQPADRETPLRRGYYTNVTRDQLISHYSKEFKWGVRLNYPPEMAKTLVRDQTSSSFLEEIVHPMRESLYINGYEPTPDKEILTANGVGYKQKTIIKYVGSNIFIRIFIGIATMFVMWVLINEWVKTSKRKLWI
ncbi:MAG: hypothetical protein AAB535_00175 [Patescibacteria group bacterium]